MKRGEITLSEIEVKWQTKASKPKKIWFFDYRKIFTITVYCDKDLFDFVIKTYAAQDGAAEHYLSPYYNIKGITSETSERKIQAAIKEFVEIQAVSVINLISFKL